MPNWCCNNIEFSHSDPAMLDKALDGWNQGKFMATLMPEPDYETTPVALTFPELTASFAKTAEEREAAAANLPTIREDSWWDWRVQNWGTKWDIGNDTPLREEVRDGQTFLIGTFESAWSPPTSFYDHMIELGFSVKASYYEPGMGFVGAYENGQDFTYGIPKDPKQIKEEIPEDLIEEWDLLYQEAE